MFLLGCEEAKKLFLGIGEYYIGEEFPSQTCKTADWRLQDSKNMERLMVSFILLMPNNTQVDANAKVSSLFKDNLRAWNPNKIQSLFNRDVASQIIVIPINLSGAKDELF